MPGTRTARTVHNRKTGKRGTVGDTLVGSQVKSIRAMTEDEILAQGWQVPEAGEWPTCIEFTNGEIVTASENPANRVDYRPGSLVGVDETGHRYQIRTVVVPDYIPQKGPKQPYHNPSATLPSNGGRVIRKAVEADPNQ